MEAYFVEWLNLTLKWIHLIVGIAWIGASFYFNWLEGNLERNKPSLGKGVAGDLWSVHGGGFYHVEKFEVSPEKLPETLHWFKWEAYMTFITGFLLLIITFYLSPSLFLVSPEQTLLTPVAGVIVAIGSIVVSWVIYDQLCKTKLVENNMMFFWIMFIFLTGVAFILSQLFTSKAAFIHVGAIIGSIMVANVFFGIIPSQKKLVSALTNNETPDPETGKKGYIRSFHNNYFTLPVLFIMISAHYPATFAHEWNWLILAAISLIGVLTRHYFNLKNKGKNYPWILPLAATLMGLLAYIAMPSKPATDSSSSLSDAQVMEMFQKHCISCHSATPTSPGFATAPKGIVFDHLSDIENHADSIYAQTVMTHAMPIANLTKMTEEERKQLGSWLNKEKN